MHEVRGFEGMAVVNQNRIVVVRDYEEGDLGRAHQHLHDKYFNGVGSALT
jgi:hypothetical protein